MSQLPTRREWEGGTEGGEGEEEGRGVGKKEGEGGKEEGEVKGRGREGKRGREEVGGDVRGGKRRRVERNASQQVLQLKQWKEERMSEV